MGEEIMKPPKSGVRAQAFNTPLECGLRSAVLLLECYPQACDLHRLEQYDYLIVHSGDVPDGPTSIHPPTPHRSGELLIRRSLVNAGLEFMGKRQVIDKMFLPEGICYCAGNYAPAFLQALSSEYVQLLQERARWVIGQYQGMPDNELSIFMREQWTRWGVEFVRDSSQWDAA